MATPPADTFHRQKMQSLLESGRFSDVTLVVVVVVGDGGSGDGDGDVLLDLKEEKEFKVHHALLATFSPVFEAMFSHPDTKEALERRVLIEDMSAETMERLLTFIYTGELKFEEKKEKVIRSLLELMAAADKYQVGPLKRKCELLLSPLITVDSVCAILQAADLHCALALRERAIAFIVRHSDRIISRSSGSAWVNFEEAASQQLIKDLLHRLATVQKKPEQQPLHSSINNQHARTRKEKKKRKSLFDSFLKF